MPDGSRQASERRPVEASRRMAREARRRIELVASRLPRAPFRRSATGPTVADRVVVISDTHIGDQFEVLTSERAIGALTETINGMGPVDELVLLGDIFDFWTAPVVEALARARDLFAALFALENVGRMVYLPGNHDHHVFRMYFAEQFAKRLREGSLEPPELGMPLTADCPVIDSIRPDGAKVPLKMVYPVHQVTVQGREILFTHGHLLGFFERSLWHPKGSMVSTLLISKTENLGLEDMERFVSPFYEMLALSAMVPGVTGGGYRLYRLLSRTGKALGLQGSSRVSAYRNTTVEENAAEIEALLDHLCPEKPDYFVYGHTHRSGRLELPVSGATAINSGCWLAGAASDTAGNTLVEISDDARLISVDL